MENNEKKKPDISFAGSDTRRRPQNRRPATQQRQTGAAVKSKAEKTAEPKEKTLDAQNEAQEQEVQQVNDVPSVDPVIENEAKEKISEHQASLDKLMYEFDKEKEQEMLSEAAEESKAVSSGEPLAESKSRAAAEKLEFSNDYSKPRPAPKKKKGKGKGKGKKKKKKHLFNFSIVGGLTITIAIVSLSIAFATGAITLGMEYLGVNKSDNDITFNIPENSTNDEIADLLVKNNIINNKMLFKAVLKMTKTTTLYPGDITLSPNQSYLDIIGDLSVMRESYETVEVTIPEGTTLLKIAKKLEKKGVCSAEDFLFEFNATQDFPLDEEITHNSDVYYSMEGYFFPDTYEFYVGDSAYNVTKTIREHFYSQITDEMYERMDELGMDLNEVITLASIVQSEAGSVEDMPKVASVFLNRLNDPDTFPNLQSDATTNYVKKVIETVETSTAMIEHYSNCYDTYTCMGLPAGPICNPGLDAINAVLYAEDTDYYYFCNNLETGKSYFAKTYKQHKKNLKKAGLSE